MKNYWAGDIAPSILDRGTRRRRVISFTPRPLYLGGNRKTLKILYIIL